MAHNDKDPVAVERGSLSPGQLQSLLKMEPKTLGVKQTTHTSHTGQAGDDCNLYRQSMVVTKGSL